MPAQQAGAHQQGVGGVAFAVGRRTRQTRQAAGQPRCASPSRARPSIAQSVMPGHGLGFDGGNTAVWSNFYHDANVPRTTLSTFKSCSVPGWGSRWVLPSQHRTSGSVCSPAMVHFGMHSGGGERGAAQPPIVFVVLVDGQWGWSR